MTKYCVKLWQSALVFFSIMSLEKTKSKSSMLIVIKHVYAYTDLCNKILIPKTINWLILQVFVNIVINEEPEEPLG